MEMKQHTSVDLFSALVRWRLDHSAPGLKLRGFGENELENAGNSSCRPLLLLIDVLRMVLALGNYMARIVAWWLEVVDVALSPVASIPSICLLALLAKKKKV